MVSKDELPEFQPQTMGSLSDYLRWRVLRSGKRHSDLVHDLGYEAGKEKLIELILSGQAKLPINKVALLADAIGVERSDLMQRVLSEYSPGTWAALQECFDLVPKRK